AGDRQRRARYRRVQRGGDDELAVGETIAEVYHVGLGTQHRDGPDFQFPPIARDQHRIIRAQHRARERHDVLGAYTLDFGPYEGADAQHVLVAEAQHAIRIHDLGHRVNDPADLVDDALGTDDLGIPAAAEAAALCGQDHFG